MSAKYAVPRETAGDAQTADVPSCAPVAFGGVPNSEAAVTIRSVLAAAVLTLLGAGAGAQDGPAKRITMIVSFPPGGVADTVARPVAEAMSRALKQTIVVEDRAGAGGNYGTMHVPMEMLNSAAGFRMLRIPYAPEFQAFWTTDAARMAEVVRCIGRVE